MGDQDSPLSRRLMARADAGLQRVATPDGGEVFKGPTARRALRALNARAFTVDDTIIVDDSFDLSNTEDQALYAHEAHHQANSGGEGGGAAGHHDAEEVAARAVERMVLHRSSAGEDFGSIMRDVRSGNTPMAQGQDQGVQREVEAASSGLDDDDPMSAYYALRGQGESHEVVVQMLASSVMESISDIEDDHHFRASSSTDFL